MYQCSRCCIFFGDIASGLIGDCTEPSECRHIDIAPTYLLTQIWGQKCSHWLKLEKFSTAWRMCVTDELIKLCNQGPALQIPLSLPAACRTREVHDNNAYEGSSASRTGQLACFSSQASMTPLHDICYGRKNCSARASSRDGRDNYWPKHQVASMEIMFSTRGMCPRICSTCVHGGSSRT